VIDCVVEEEEERLISNFSDTPSSSSVSTETVIAEDEEYLLIRPTSPPLPSRVVSLASMKPCSILLHRIEIEDDLKKASQPQQLPSTAVTRTRIGNKIFRKYKNATVTRLRFSPCTRILHHFNRAQHKGIRTRSSTCPHCSIRFQSAVNLNAHLEENHSGRGAVQSLWKCSHPQCHYEGTDETVLKNHQQQNHPELDKHTNANPNYPLVLRQPERGAEPIWKCTMCKFVGSNGSALQKHQAQSHPNHRFRLNPLHPCSVCNKMTSTLSMPSHRRLYHPEVKPFGCFQCPYETSTNSAIIRHQKCHDGEKSYKCLLCTASYKTQRGCNLHIQAVHPGKACTTSFQHNRGQEKKTSKGSSSLHPCSICKQTINGSKMPSHRRLYHPEVQPFQCFQCPYDTSIWDRMRRHRKCHEGEEAFKCSFCTASYKTRYGCNRHIQAVHPGKACTTSFQHNQGQEKKPSKGSSSLHPPSVLYL